MQTFKKQPTEVKDVNVDFTDYFSSIGGDTINTCVVTVVSGNTGVGDLTLNPAPTAQAIQVGGQVVKFWVGAGTSGVTYQLQAFVVTTGNRKRDIDLKIKVQET